MTITGIVFNDANGNSIQDNGETGIADMTVSLDDAVLRQAGRSTHTTRTALTDSNGVYTFSNVPAGQYTLSFQTPPGATGVAPAPVNINAGSGTVTVPPVVAQVSWINYLSGIFK